MSVGAGQRGVSRRFLVVLGAGLAAAVALSAVLLSQCVGRNDVVPLTAAERQELVRRETVDGPILEHPAVGFAIDHPGDNYFASAETVRGIRKTNDDPSTRFYAYAELKSGNLLVVSLSMRPGLGAGGFADMVHNVWKEFVQKTAVRLGRNVSVRTVEDRVDAGPPGTASLHAVLGAGASLRLRAISSGPYVIMAIGVGLADDLAPVVASLRATASPASSP